MRDHTPLIKRLTRFLVPPPASVPEGIALRLENHDGLSRQQIMTFSTQDWSDLWTRKQRFVLQFARQGNLVVYIETQFHWLSYFKNFRRQWRRLYLFAFGPRGVEENLYVYTPPLLLPAFQVYPILAAINNFVLAFFLRRVMKRLGITQPVLWLYTHFNRPLVKKLGCKHALYECVDDYAGAKGLIKAKVVREQEAATLQAVNAAIVTAETLKPPMEPYLRNIHVVSNAANVSHFNRAAERSKIEEPVDLKAIPHPRLVFLGAMAYWVDQDLLEYVAQSRLQWHIVLVGPVSTNIDQLRPYANVHFLGRKPYELLPDYLAYCDVALNPYKVDDVAKGCSPLKLYEYMAAGLPIVSTEMPEARRFPNIVTVAENYQEFGHAIESTLQRDAISQNRHVRMALKESQNHSWENRFLAVEQVAREALS